MTKTVALLELAERVENATGPDRELDAAIAAAVHLKQLTYQPGEWIKDPEFTASLDAAMQLVGDCLLVALSDIAADGLPGCCLCSDTSTSPPTEHWGAPRVSGPREQVLALAICAAALRALASQGNNNGTSRETGKPGTCHSRAEPVSRLRPSDECHG